jgi:hypothetical protein
MQLWEAALGWKSPRFTHGPTLRGPPPNSGQPLAKQMTASAAMSFGTANALTPSRQVVNRVFEVGDPRSLDQAKLLEADLKRSKADD